MDLKVSCNNSKKETSSLWKEYPQAAPKWKELEILRSLWFERKILETYIHYQDGMFKRKIYVAC